MLPDRPFERWYHRAAQDLAAAETLLRRSDPPVPYPLVCFHAQQAAEKYLKGWLVSRGRKAPRTHDLEYLLRRAERIEPAFRDLGASVASLTDFAVAPRYPGDLEDPGEAEASRAIEEARAVRDLAERLGPPPSQPGRPLK